MAFLHYSVVPRSNPHQKVVKYKVFNGRAYISTIMYSRIRKSDPKEQFIPIKCMHYPGGGRSKKVN